MSEFLNWFDMGGYAPYVWSAYAITFVVLVANLWWARQSFARSFRRAERLAAKTPKENRR